VKGLRVAGARSLEDANRYLHEVYLPMWNQRFTHAPSSSVDAHRPLLKSHELASILSRHSSRQITNGYTLRLDNCTYQMDRADARPRYGTRRSSSSSAWIARWPFAARMATCDSLHARTSLRPFPPTRARHESSAPEPLDENFRPEEQCAVMEDSQTGLAVNPIGCAGRAPGDLRLPSQASAREASPK